MTIFGVLRLGAVDMPLVWLESGMYAGMDG